MLAEASLKNRQFKVTTQSAKGSFKKQKSLKAVLLLLFSPSNLIKNKKAKLTL